jgi:hypothetical protein
MIDPISYTVRVNTTQPQIVYNCSEYTSHNAIPTLYIFTLWNEIGLCVSEENLVPRFHGYGKALVVTEGVTFYFHENHMKV